MKRQRLVLVLMLAILGSLLLPAAAVNAAGGRSAEHARVVSFWTPDKVARAIPRDVVLDARHPVALGKPGSGPGNVVGGSWTGGGAVVETTGKLLFSMGDGYYVCSGSVVADQSSDRSVVLTAGHCVVDETDGSWATNWMFIPDYDAKPATLTSSGSFCTSTQFGCWVADSLIASDEFANAGGFTTNATLHDYAFAVVSTGGLSGDAQLDSTVGAQSASFTSGVADAATYLFGYPAAGKFKGSDLTYSLGPLGYDARVGDQTYRVTSSMTGGSSGGPWFQAFDAASGRGTIMSVTSYGYSGTKALYGPMLNAETASMFDLARTAVPGVNALG